MTYRKMLDVASSKWMLISFILVLLLPFAIAAGLTVKSSGLWTDHSIIDLITSSDWSPSDGRFGFWPFIVSSLWVTATAILISLPLCLLSAIYLSQFAPKWLLKMMHPVLDILAGVPSVVFGVWAILIIVPLVRDHVAPFFHTTSVGYCILTAAIVLSVMTIPYILNLLLQVFRHIPVELAEASLSIGATKWETIRKVFLRKGAAGIWSAYGLGFSKALGETLAVMMVIGNIARVPGSVFDAGYPLPALIANNYGEMMSIPSYDSALMFGALLLLVIILLINIFFRYIIYKSEAL